MLSKTIVKYIQSLAHKKFRDEYNVFIAEGPKVVTELLVSQKYNVKMVCGTAEWMAANISVLKTLQPEDKLEIQESELEKISLLTAPNKVVAVFFKNDKSPPSLENNISLMLDDIQDPGNMGTIIRIADWFGIKNIICSTGCVDSYNPKVVQATMGSIARINIVYTELLDFIIKNKDTNIYAASLVGKNVSTMKIKEGIIVIGNEGRGINENLLQYANENIAIPKRGEAESLNAAVACGIILSHVL